MMWVKYLGRKHCYSYNPGFSEGNTERKKKNNIGSNG